MEALADQMSVYSAYHRHPVNKVIHFVFVPAIVWSIMVLTGMLPLFSFLNLTVTLAHLLVLPILAYYLKLDFALGVASVLLFTVLLATALQVAALPTATALWVGGAVFVAGWVVQFVGHGVWEKRRPALADNLFQVFIAPIFIVAEFAFMMGLKKDLHAAVEARVPQHLPDEAAARPAGA